MKIFTKEKFICNCGLVSLYGQSDHTPVDQD